MTKQDMASFVKERIQELEALRYDAVLKEDYETFAMLEHKDLVYTHSNGDRDTWPLTSKSAVQASLSHDPTPHRGHRRCR